MRYLCEKAGVSRSGYYAHFSKKANNNRALKQSKDEILRDNILKAYKFKNRKKGARQIKMVLEKQFGINYNLKRIRRIMKKYGIVCPIRRARPYSKIVKAFKEHSVFPNHLNREFKNGKPREILLTDITYLFYGKRQRAYLSTVKDSVTNEILAYQLSRKYTLDIATQTIEKLINNKKINLAPNAFIHSDQGCHYTSPRFQKLMRNYNLGQSMSRRGNCWDNAPIESFFGHFKDEANIKECKTYRELKKEIDDYMDYYNNYRGQWNLKRMTPVEYRKNFFKSA